VSGRFIVLEGGEACGKTTQARLLVARLRAEGREVVATFEPGKTGVGARIRALLLDGPERIAPATEALLLAADRAQHVEEVVRPALERGADVVSDRYVPSSLAYQGIGRGLGVDRVEELNRWATGGLDADLVVVLDVPDQTVAGREVGPPDRLEREGGDFHARVRDAYRVLARERGWIVVDAGRSVDEVAEAVWAAVAGS
jgi:dTMP kinase